MISLMLGHNHFTGQVPTDLYKMRILTYFDISGNQ